jgi:hypothetical protein
MKKAVLTAAALMLSAMAAHADSIGVVACDDFITKYETCATKAPAAQQATLKAQIEQLKKSWTDLAKDSNTKPALEMACKQVVDQMKAPMQAYGCSF